jgi:ADP-ribose pyrophosphatase
MELISSVEKYRSKIFYVTEDEARDPDGFYIKRCIVRHPGSAVMMAIDDDGRILLVRQYRVPARAFLWELPAGKIDPGELPMETAKRELVEETGYSATNWKQLTTFYPSPGYVEERMTLFLATGLTKGEAHNMEDERIAIKWFTRQEVAAMIRTGDVMDAKTIIGYYMSQET